MDTIIVEFDKNDVELRDALRNAFGEQFSMVESKGFDSGAVNVVQAILPVVSALTPILVAYFARPKTPPQTQRIVVTRTGGMTLEGYTAEDVERLVERASKAD